MARKQSKSVNTTKKSSSVCVSTKKGGKVQKKVSESKTKKKVESQLKQAVKLQGKQNKSQPKVSSPANSSKRSSRSNNDCSRKSLTSTSHRTSPVKNSTTTKALNSPRTRNSLSASKRKSNPIEQPKPKKQVRPTKTTKPKRLNKNEISPAGNKNTKTETSARGKKRSYAHLVSDNTTEVNNEEKRRKTNDSKSLTSRRTRNIKPTIKGSEWRKTILERKSTTTKPEIPSKKLKKTPIKNKSPNNNRKTSPSKSISTAKQVKKTPTKSSKQQTGVKALTEKTKDAPLPKKNVKTTTKNKTVQSKSPKARSSNRQSVSKRQEKECSSLEGNALATSIKNKFNSCFSNKRNKRGTELQENVLVAQGILNDIINSVGTPDVSSIVDKAVDTVSFNSTISDSKTSVLNELDEKDTHKGIQETNMSSETITSKSESVSNMDVEKKLVTATDNIETTTPVEVGNDILLSKVIDKKSQNHLDETLEEIELHLSDTSDNGDDLVTSKVKSNSSTNIENALKLNRNSESKDQIKSVLNSDDQLKMEIAHEHTNFLSNKNISHENGHDLVNDSTEGSSVSCNVSESSQINNDTDERLQKDNANNKFPADTTISHSSTKPFDLKVDAKIVNTEQIAKEKNDVIVCEKEEDVGPNNQNNQNINGSAYSKNESKKELHSSNKSDEKNKSKETPVGQTSLKCTTEEITNTTESKLKKASKVPKHQHGDTLKNGEEKAFGLNGNTTSSLEDSSSTNKIDSPYHSKPEEKVCETNHSNSESMNDTHKVGPVSGDEKIPQDEGLKKIDQTIPNCKNQPQLITPPENYRHSLQVSQENKGNTDNKPEGDKTTNVFQSNVSAENNVANLKEVSTMPSIVNTNSHKNCLEEEKVSIEKSATKVKASQKDNHNSELNVKELKISEELPMNSDLSSNILQNNSDPPSKCSNQTVYSVNVDSLNSMKEKPHGLEPKNQTLVSEIVVSHLTKTNFTKISEDASIEAEKSMSSNKSISPPATEVSKMDTKDVDFYTNQHECTRKEKLETGSSSGLTQEFDTISLGGSEGTKVEHCSKEEQLYTKDSKGELKHEHSTNRVSLGSPVSSVQTEKNISGENSSVNGYKSEHSCPTENNVSINKEVPEVNFDVSTNQHECTRKEKLETGSSTGLTQEFDTISLGGSEGSKVEHCSKEEQLNTEDSKGKLKYESSTNRVSLGSPVSSEHSCPNENNVSMNKEMPGDIIESKGTSEESSKMELGS